MKSTILTLVRGVPVMGVLLFLLAGCGGGGGSGGTTTPTATNPVPSISSLSPSSIAAGSAAITLTVNGSDFVTGSVIEWNGSSIATSVAGSTSLSAVVPATDLATSGSASVTVVNPAPGGGTSSAATFSITATNPMPSLSSLSPNSVGAGSLPITLTVTGSDFVSGSTVDWNGAALTTTYVSAMQLQATVPASDLATAGSFDVTVVSPTPGGGTSGASTFTVTTGNPAPSLTSISPISCAAGSTAFTLIVTGSGFVSGSTVDWNGTALTTTYVSASQLKAAVPASALTSAGTATVTVVSPTPGGGTSAAQTFTITSTNPVPTLSSLSPATAGAGSTALTLTVAGADFVTNSTVDWNGVALTTTFVNAAQLAASVPASDLTTAGSASVTVMNPAPGGGTSSAATFSIMAANPAPTLSSVSPSTATVGSTAVSVIVTGSDFVSASVVQWNGTALATTFVSATQLHATIPASDLGAVGSGSLTVVNPAPGGGTSSAASFTIAAASGTTPSIRQSALYSAYPGDVSANWKVTLNNVQQGSTIYVIGVFPLYAAMYADMAVSDGTNTYTQLDRHNDSTLLFGGIEGTEAMVHWYAANVNAGNYIINMAPASAETYEDWVAVLAIEVVGTQASPLVGHAIHFQSNLAPGSNNISVSVTSTASTGLFIATTFDDADYANPTAPLLGPALSAYSGNGELWNPAGAGDAMGSGYRAISVSGVQTATFSAEEPATNAVYPDYLTTGVIFH